MYHIIEDTILAETPDLKISTYKPERLSSLAPPSTPTSLKLLSPILFKEKKIKPHVEGREGENPHSVVSNLELIFEEEDMEKGKSAYPSSFSFSRFWEKSKIDQSCLMVGLVNTHVISSTFSGNPLPRVGFILPTRNVSKSQKLVVTIFTLKLKQGSRHLTNSWFQ